MINQPEAHDIDLDVAKARFDMTLALMEIVFSLGRNEILRTTRGGQTESAMRQIAAYLVQVEGDATRSTTARLFGRDDTAFARALDVIEEKRDIRGIDDALAAIGRAIRDLAAIKAAWVMPERRAGREAVLDALRVCGEAMHEVNAQPVAPPTAADRVRQAKAFDDATRQLTGALAALMQDPMLSNIMHKSPNAATATKMDQAEVVKIKAASKTAATDILARMKAVFAASAFRVIYAEPHQTGQGRTYVAYAKVAPVEKPAIVEPVKKARRA